MRFYRHLQPFKVISFDLDDTLYDNTQVIRLAEQQFIDTAKQFSQIEALTLDNWRQWKSEIANRHPVLCENVIAWREMTLRHVLQYYGQSTVEIDRTLAAAMETFIEWRHKIDIPPSTFEVLNYLKACYPLSVISNGNVVARRIGLDYFEIGLRGGEHGRTKPHHALFHQTAVYFKIKPREILHVGDNLVTDVQGAMQAGCQAVWLNPTSRSINDFKEARLLPTLEITELTELLRL